MTNEQETSDFSEVLRTLEQASELWPKIFLKIKAAWRRSQEGLREGELWEVECLLGDFEEKVTLVAQKAQLEAEQKPTERFYPWLHNALLLQVHRQYQKIFTPQWYMDLADHGLEALKGRLSSTALSAGDRERMTERLEKAGETIKEILTSLKNPPANRRGRRRS